MIKKNSLSVTMFYIWIFCLLSVQALSAETIERRFFLMGTSFDLAIQASNREQGLRASEQIYQAIDRMEKRISTWRPNSEFSDLNQSPVGGNFPLSPSSLKDLRKAFLCADQTSGAFDPAIGSLVEAWGLRGHGKIPSESELRAARLVANYKNFELTQTGIRRKSPQAKIEEGGFGKGLALEKAKETAIENHLSEMNFNFGGQILFQSTLKKSLSVSVADPEDRFREVLKLDLPSGFSLSTSGNSEHGLKVDGVSVGHILDPKTGKPSSYNGSVTVLAPSALRADCLSTAFFVMGADRGLKWVRENPLEKAEVIFAVKQKDKILVKASCGLKNNLQGLLPETALEFDCSSQIKKTENL